MSDSVMGFACPIPKYATGKILLGHGSGGKLSADLLETVILPKLKNEILDQGHDGAVLEVGQSTLAFTTDSYVVSPYIFPGGDIGSLAVFGTVNDLAMCGAIPKYISLGFILEEGFPLSDFEQILNSISAAAKKAGVQIVTGDTKVVEKGKCDGIFINTSGIGIVNAGISVNPKNVKPGQLVIISGTLADHGMTILSARENLEFETELKSDSAPLNDLVNSILLVYPQVPMMRDVTRGGLASVLNEIAESSSTRIEIDETLIPIKEEVSAFCELLGFDPLYVATEGKCVVFADPEFAEDVLEAMKKSEFGTDSRIIGRVTETTTEPRLILRTKIGSKRIVDRLPGDQLPRIC